MSAQALEGNKPLGVAHRHTPDLPDLHFEGPITLELGVIVLKAQRPIFIEGEHTCPDPWPGLGVTVHPIPGLLWPDQHTSEFFLPQNHPFIFYWHLTGFG